MSTTISSTKNSAAIFTKKSTSEQNAIEPLLSYESLYFLKVLSDNKIISTQKTIKE